MKRALAVRRWWITGATAALVAARIATAAAFRLLGREPAEVGVGLTTALAAYDVVCLVLAATAIVAFVQYGRIFNPRIPTE